MKDKTFKTLRPLATIGQRIEAKRPGTRGDLYRFAKTLTNNQSRKGPQVYKEGK